MATAGKVYHAGTAFVNLACQKQAWAGGGGGGGGGLFWLSEQEPQLKIMSPFPRRSTNEPEAGWTPNRRDRSRGGGRSLYGGRLEPELITGRPCTCDPRPF